MVRTLGSVVSIILFVVPLFAQPQSNRREVTEKEFGEKWPLTIDKGAIACYEGRAVVFIVNTDVYALNGTAKSQKKYREIDRIQKDNPHTPGAKLSVGPLIDEGLKLCS